MSKYGAKAYKKMAVTTASRGQILLMLYEAAIRNVKKASDCIDKKDIAGKGMAIGKAHDIINELNNTLDFETGGDIAAQLEQLYNFMTSSLIKANLHNDKSTLESTCRILENLLDGWRQAVKEVETGQVQPQNEK